MENTLCIAQLACSCLGGTLVAGWQQYPGKTPNNFLYHHHYQGIQVNMTLVDLHDCLTSALPRRVKKTQASGFYTLWTFASTGIQELFFKIYL